MATNGFYVLMRDKFILEGMWPYKNQRELTEASRAAHAALQYNERCYQGSFKLSHVPNENPVTFMLKPYMETLVTQEETIKRTGNWVPTPTH